MAGLRKKKWSFPSRAKNLPQSAFISILNYLEMCTGPWEIFYKMYLQSKKKSHKKQAKLKAYPTVSVIRSFHQKCVKNYWKSWWDKGGNIIKNYSHWCSLPPLPSPPPPSRQGDVRRKSRYVILVGTWQPWNSTRFLKRQYREIYLLGFSFELLQLPLRWSPYCTLKTFRKTHFCQPQ